MTGSLKQAVQIQGLLNMGQSLHDCVINKTKTPEPLVPWPGISSPSEFGTILPSHS